MEDYEEYIKLMCNKYHKTREEVEQMAIVREVMNYLESKSVCTME